MKKDTFERQGKEELVQLASFPESNPNPIVEVDLTGKVHYLNPAAKRLFPDLPSMGPYHPWLVGLESFSEERKNKQRGSFFREVKIGNVWYEQAIHYVQETKHLRIYGLDITERRQVEAEHRTIIKTAMDGFWLTDGEGNFLDVNDAYCRLVGYSRDELLTMRAHDVEAVETVEETNEHIRRVKEVGWDRFETRHRTKDSRILDLEVSVNYMEDRGGRFFVFLRDISRRKQAEEAVRKALQESRQREAEISALLQGSRAVLEHHDFKEAARTIFNSCKNLIGATGGYVALLSQDGTQNDALFIESGDLPCRVDPALPFPVRGLRARAYRTGKPVYENDFMNSQWIEFMPPGHAPLENVLFAPLVLKGKALGLLGLANKPGGFNENDSRMASGFSEFAAIALITKRAEEERERLLEELERRVEKRTAELVKVNERLRLLSSELLTIQEKERKRVAQELHDGIGQMLTAIKFRVENILQQGGERKARAREKALSAVIPMIQESIEEVRRIQMDLRPSTLDDLGILATIAWFCREYQTIYSSVSIEKQIDIEETEVPAILKTAIFRIMQEAMNNIAKHSKADRVRLSLGKREGKIDLAIQDNGEGFDSGESSSRERSKRGFGLSSMKERTELSGGLFAIQSSQGQGTVIRATWPL